MTGLVLPAPFALDLYTRLLADPRETCAILYTRASGARRLVCAGDLVPDMAYARRDPVAAELTPAYLVEISNMARREQAGVVMVHTHPMAHGVPAFSAIDDKGEVPLASFFEALLPTETHCAMVVGPQGVRSRHLGRRTPVPVTLVGRTLDWGTVDTAASAPGTEVHDRQIRAFGAEGQVVLSAAKVAIVGLGGTGSVVAQELSHLGIGALLLIDPDTIEVTNLNRVVGAGPKSVGRPKVFVARDMVRRINPSLHVEALKGDILDPENTLRLREADFIFSCTDSHASRAVISQCAYQHLIPAIDMGVAIETREGSVVQITGRTQMLAPGLACLSCTAALDGHAIRRELMNVVQRAADPYFVGDGVPQPAVISFNATIASFATSMFLAAVTGIPSAARHLWYDGLSGAVRPMSATPDSACFICSPTGALARGDAGPALLRRAH